tara:strand:+ start:93 stop:1157 length:1065 start_codon:yes stop_codon:yes gene_type:complete
MNTFLFLGDFFKDARCVNMADSIIDVGKDVVIIDAGTGSEIYRNQKIHHITLPDSGIYKYWKFYQESKNLLKQISPQCTIAGDLYSLPSAVSQSSSKLIYDSREIYTQLAGLASSPIKQFFWNFIEFFFIYSASTVIVTADSDSEVLKSIYGDIPCITLKNLPSQKNLPNSPRDLHAELNIPPLAPIFLYQGMLHKGRGIEQLLPLLNIFDDAHYVILGDGPLRIELEKLSVKHEVQNRVHCLGSVPYSELMRYTASATIGFSLIEPISESYMHALPNKIFEYAAVGLPVIATDLPEMKTAISEFKLGYCVKFADKNALIDAIKKILQQENISKTQPNPQLFWEAQANKFLEII